MGMKITRLLSGLTLAVALVLSLSACETLGLKSKPKGDAVDLACPPVETPAALTSMSKTGASPMDMLVSSNLHVTGTECKVGKENVTLKVNVELIATRGPALKTDSVSLPFFAAVVDQGGQLLNKKMYETTFNYSGRDITDRETVELNFDMPKTQAAATRVYIGYQLTQDAWKAMSASNGRQP